MKNSVIFVIALFCYVECRKVVPIDKNANLAFINMEAGGAGGPKTAPVKPPGPAKPTVAPGPAKPAVAPTPAPAKPAAPAKPLEPAAVHPTPAPVAVPVPLPTKPATQIQPKPVNPPPATNPITTPGPGSVKQLINFYDSQGKASPIRPYSYSQAVKQG